MNCRHLQIMWIARPWMTMALSILMLTSLGCCGNRGNRLIQWRNFCERGCYCTRPAVETPETTEPVSATHAPDCATVPTSANLQKQSVVAGEPVKSPDHPQSKPIAGEEQVAPPKPEASSRKNGSTGVQAKTGERTSVQGSNDKLHGISDPEMIRQLAMTPMAPEPSANSADSVLDKTEPPTSDELAGTQLLANPGVPREPKNVIPATEQVQNLAEAILQAIQLPGKTVNEPSLALPNQGVDLHPDPVAPIARIDELPRMVVLRAVVPESLMRRTESMQSGHQFSPVTSQIDSGVPALQASQFRNEQPEQGITLMARPLAPGSFPPPQSNELIFRQPDSVILKAGSLNTSDSVQENQGVAAPTNAAKIIDSGN